MADGLAGSDVDEEPSEARKLALHHAKMLKLSKSCFRVVNKVVVSAKKNSRDVLVEDTSWISRRWSSQL